MNPVAILQPPQFGVVEKPISNSILSARNGGLLLPRCTTVRFGHSGCRAPKLEKWAGSFLQATAGDVQCGSIVASNIGLESIETRETDVLDSRAAIAERNFGMCAFCKARVRTGTDMPPPRLEPFRIRDQAIEARRGKPIGKNGFQEQIDVETGSFHFAASEPPPGAAFQPLRQRRGALSGANGRPTKIFFGNRRSARRESGVVEDFFDQASTAARSGAVVSRKDVDRWHRNAGGGYAARSAQFGLRLGWSIQETEAIDDRLPATQAAKLLVASADKKNVGVFQHPIQRHELRDRRHMDPCKAPRGIPIRALCGAYTTASRERRRCCL